MRSEKHCEKVRLCLYSCLSVGPSDFEKTEVSLFKAFTRGIATVSCADL